LTLERSERSIAADLAPQEYINNPVIGQSAGLHAMVVEQVFPFPWWHAAARRCALPIDEWPFFNANANSAG
jgi:hypothetical protein